MRSLILFLFLQIADFATTFCVINLGGGEGNPIVKRFIEALGVVNGLVVAKVLIIALAGGILIAKKARVIRMANVVFAVIVLWNASLIARVLSRGDLR